MKKLLYYYLLGAPLAVWALSSPEKSKTPRAETRLISSIDAYSDETASFYIALDFQMAPDWHIYWKNSGDSGTPPMFDASASDESLRFSEISWPAPKRISVPPLMSYAYDGRATLPIKVDVAPQAQSPLRLRVQANWLICKVECLPENKNFTLSIPYAGKNQKSTLAREGALIHDALQRVPARDESMEASFTREATSFRLQFTSKERDLKGIESAYFFPDESLRIKHAAEQKLAHAGGSLSLDIPRDDNEDESKDTLAGLLELRRGEASEVVAVTLQRNIATPPLDAQQFLYSLFFALLGGLILNLMPCVFPVLFLKIYSIARRPAGDPQTRREAWAYALGVLVSFWLLALLLVGLKSAGLAVGWGFQLQSSPFVAGAFLLFVLLGLSLIGLFEVGGSISGVGQKFTEKSGRSGAFFTGVLATLVATPCSAPFMGAAVGYALTRQSWELFPVFTMLAVGLALPYVVLAYLPRLLSWIPKPGPWMEHLKQFFGFAMFGTSLWLLWIFGTQKGLDASILLLAAALLVGLATWSLKLKKLSRGLCLIFSLAAAVILLAKSLQFVDAAASAVAEEKWERFSPEALSAAQKNGEAVFIDFTASWCLTCQVNKRLVLHTPEAEKIFSENKIRLMRADWTSYDPIITRTLAGFGRQSVPVYVFYPANSSTPRLLPELLTLDILAKNLLQSSP